MAIDGICNDHLQIGSIGGQAWTIHGHGWNAMESQYGLRQLIAYELSGSEVVENLGETEKKKKKRKFFFRRRKRRKKGNFFSGEDEKNPRLKQRLFVFYRNKQ